MKAFLSFSCLSFVFDLFRSGFEDEHEGRVQGGVWVLGLVLMLNSLSCQAQEPQAFARSSVSTSGEIYTGQKVVWVVELGVPGYFSGTPSYDLPDVPGLLILPPQGRPTLSTENSDGTSMTVQRMEFSIFAHRAGAFQIPPMPIRLGYKRNPLDAKAAEGQVRTPAFSISARRPPGSGKTEVVLSAVDLKAEEEWRPKPGPAKAGTAFTRTITFSASDVPGMAFPPFPEEKIEGLGIYRKSPEVLDENERGSLKGKRRETITYVCERPGRYRIPAYQLNWWNPEAQTLEKIEFPEQNIYVEGSGPGIFSRPDLKWIFTALVIFGFVAGPGWFLGKRTAGAWLRQILVPWRAVHLFPLNPSNKDTIARRR